MRNLPRLIYFLFLLSTLLASRIAFAVDSTMPKDPKELLRLAAKSNNLADPELHPWHLKASYTLFDLSGNPASQGTFEEWWASPRRTKTQYDSPLFAQTDYFTEKGRFRRGAQTAPSMPLSWLGGQFTDPVAVNEQQVNMLFVDREVQKRGGVKFVCLRESGFQTPTGARRFVGLGFCLELEQPVLVSTESMPPNPFQFERENIKSFQGRYVPSRLIALQDGRKVMEAQIQTLEELNGIDDATFALPPDAVSVPLKVNISAAVAASMLIKKTTPDYPAAAQSAGVSGTVSLEALIGKDGHIEAVQAIRGPTELRQAAIDAVQTWVYKPFLLNEVPVEVNTTINVIFTHSR